MNKNWYTSGCHTLNALGYGTSVCESTLYHQPLKNNLTGTVLYNITTLQEMLYETVAVAFSSSIAENQYHKFTYV